MQSLKPGRGPALMGGIGSLGVAVFGVFWFILSFAVAPHNPPLVGILFPLFGIVLAVMGLVGAVYNFTNATSAKRFSAFDVTNSHEEPDPLNEHFGHVTETDISGGSVESRLAKVSELKSKGLISEAEYAEQRRKILSSL
jgi:hypothetical protein